MDKSQKSIIKKGFEILKQTKNYTQSTVVKKIKALGLQTAPATFSKILKDTEGTGQAAMHANAVGIKKLLELECCLQWDAISKDFIQIKNCSPTIVQEWSEQMAYQPAGFKFHHKGRLSILEKTQFFSTAKNEMIEFGLTLNTFTNYFFSRNEDEFKNPIHNLLKRGVNIKCYLLDPMCKEAMLYFEDRKKFVPKDREGISKIKNSLLNFNIILKEIAEFGFSGKMEVFTYRRIPHQYALAIDPGSLDGKLQVSHYLYGELRARCPVIECSRSSNASLYIRYWDSLEKLTRGSVRVTDFEQYRD